MIPAAAGYKDTSCFNKRYEPVHSLSLPLPKKFVLVLLGCVGT